MPGVCRGVRSGTRWLAVTTAALCVGLAACAKAAPARALDSATITSGPTILATAGGTVWSVDGLGDVERSTDGGRSWHVVLRPPTGDNSLGITATWFDGPYRAWAAEGSSGVGSPTITMRSTDNGGRTWSSVRVPTASLPGASVVFTTLDFSDPTDGWLLGVYENFDPDGANTLGISLWRTVDGGSRWQRTPAADLPFRGKALPTNSETACPSVTPTLDFTSAKVGYLSPGGCGAGTHPAIWRTDDGGTTWAASPLPVPKGGWGPAQPGPDGYGGAVVVGPVTDVTGELLAPASRGNSVTVVERSTDGGRTWSAASRVPTGATPGRPTAAGFEPLSAKAWLDAVPGALLSTHDGGQNWERTPSDLTVTGPVSFISPTDGWASPGGGQLVAAESTTDGGADWSPAPLPAGLRPTPGSYVAEPVALGTSGGRLLAGGNTGLAVSSDQGRTWQRTLPATEPVDAVHADAGELVTITGDGAVAVSTDGGRTWNAWPVPPSDGLGQVSAVSAMVAFASTGEGLAATTDAGRRWTTLSAPNGWQVSDDCATAAAGTADGELYVVATAGRPPHSRTEILSSTDAGRAWRVSLPAVDLPAGAAVDIAACDGHRAVATVTSPAVPDEATWNALTNLLVTSDGGRRWLDALQSPGRGPRPAVPAEPGGAFSATQLADAEATLQVAVTGSAVWVVSTPEVGSSSVWSSSDAGVRWSAGTLPSASDPVAIVADSGTTSWVLSPAGKNAATATVLETADGGRSWIRIGTVSLPA